MRQSQAETLQKKLLASRYSVIDEMVNVRSSLQKQQLKRSMQKQRLNEMKKRVLKLQAEEEKNKKQSVIIQSRLIKLEDSQSMASNLLQLKMKEFEKREEELETKRKNCLSMRTSLKQARQRSFDILDMRKKKKLINEKEKDFTVVLEWQRKSEADLANRMSTKNKIKQQEEMAKSRLQRYQQFKLAQAEFNYALKKERELQKHYEYLRELQMLKEKVSEQNYIFQKTQILQKETNRIESLYLTSDCS